MTSKTTFFTSAFLTSAALLAPQQAHSVAHNLSGVWVGAALGGAVAGSTNYKATLNNAEILKHTGGVKGFLGEVLAGVQKDFGSVVLGGELTVGAGAAKLSATANNGEKYTADQKVSLEAAARFGVKVSDTMQVYAKAGIANTAFDRNIPVNADATGVETKVKAKKLNGLVLGLGFEAKLKEIFLVGIEAKHTAYTEDKANLTGTGGITVTDTFKPKVTSVMVRFSYKIT